MKTTEELNILAAKLCGLDIETKIGHTWKLTTNGSIDIWGYCEGDYHNGPLCERCGYGYCHHCTKESGIEQECIPNYPDFCKGKNINLLLELVEKSNLKLRFIQLLTKLPDNVGIYEKFKLMYDFPFVVKCCLTALGELDEND